MRATSGKPQPSPNWRKPVVSRCLPRTPVFVPMHWTPPSCHHHDSTQVCKGSVVAGNLYGHRVTFVDGVWSLELAPACVGMWAQIDCTVGSITTSSEMPERNRLNPPPCLVCTTGLLLTIVVSGGGGGKDCGMASKLPNIGLERGMECCGQHFRPT